MGFWVSVLHFIVSMLLNWCMGFGFLFFISQFHCIYKGIWASGFPVLHFFLLGVWFRVHGYMDFWLTCSSLIFSWLCGLMGYYFSLHRIFGFCSSLHSFIEFAWVYGRWVFLFFTTFFWVYEFMGYYTGLLVFVHVTVSWCMGIWFTHPYCIFHCIFQCIFQYILQDISRKF